MQLKVFRSLWGTDESVSVEQRLEQVASAGFNGVDGFPTEGYTPAEYRSLVESFGLELMVSGIAESMDDLEATLGGLAEYETAQDRADGRPGCHEPRRRCCLL